VTTLAQVRDGLEARLKTIVGLRVYDHVPDDVQFPAATIEPPTVPDYRQNLAANLLSATIQIDLFVSAAIDRKQMDLYDYVEPTGARSILAAIEADRTLGLVAVDAFVLSAEPLGLVTYADTQCYGAAVTVQVFLGG